MTLSYSEPMTAEELERLPDDGLRHELVTGFVVSEPPAGFPHGDVAGRIFDALTVHVRHLRLGRLISADTGFLLARNPDTVRAPDVAFVSAARLKEAGDVRGYFPGPPDLAVEVLSPSDSRNEAHGKIADYLATGCRLVVLVDPLKRRVELYRSLTAPQFLSVQDDFEAPDILPGLRVPVRSFFED